jgi:hypothetical protein
MSLVSRRGEEDSDVSCSDGCLLDARVNWLCNCKRAGATPPYTLTNSEIEAIVTGIRSARKDLDDPSYRNFRAVSHPDGQIDVCGWFRPQRDSEESPFIGTLFAGQFVLQQFGGDPFQDGKVISDCRNRGIEL